jgi:hypothetical protein
MRAGPGKDGTGGENYTFAKHPYLGCGSGRLHQESDCSADDAPNCS